MKIKFRDNLSVELTSRLEMNLKRVEARLKGFPRGAGINLREDVCERRRMYLVYGYVVSTTTTTLHNYVAVISQMIMQKLRPDHALEIKRKV